MITRNPPTVVFTLKDKIVFSEKGESHSIDRPQLYNTLPQVLVMTVDHVIFLASDGLVAIVSKRALLLDGIFLLIEGRR